MRSVCTTQGNYMKQFYTLCLTLLPLILTSQVLEKDVITSAGGQTVSLEGDIDLHWSVGELAVTTLSTENLQLTQGYHQLDLVVDPIFEWGSDQLQISIFPNPTQDLLHLQQEHQTEFQIELRDLLGKMIQREIWSTSSKTLELHHLPANTYMLTLISNGQIKSLKIQKIN